MDYADSSDSDGEAENLSLRDRTIVEHCETLVKHANALTVSLRTIANQAKQQITRSAPDKLPYVHVGGKSMISFRLGKPPANMPEVNALGNPMYRAGASGSTYVTSLSGDDWLAYSHKEELQAMPLLKKRKAEAAAFTNGLRITKRRLKDTSVASTKYIWVPPDYVANQEQKIDIITSLAWDRELQDPSLLPLKNRVKEEVQYVAGKTSVLGYEEILRGLTVGKNMQVYHEGFPTVEAMKAIPALLRSDNYHFEFNKTVTGPSDDNELLKVMGQIVKLGRKEKWEHQDVKDAVRSINYKGTVVESVRNSFLGSWVDVTEGRRYNACLNEWWGKHETIIAGRYIPLAKSFTYQNRNVPRKFYNFITYTEVQVELYGLGTANIAFEQGKLKSYRYHCHKTKAVDLFCKIVALFSMHHADERTEYGEHPKDPFFLWEKIKKGTVYVNVSDDCRMMNFNGLALTESGVKWSHRSMDNLLMLPVRPTFPELPIGGTPGGGISIRVPVKDERGDYEVDQIEFTANTGPTFKIRTITFKKPTTSKGGAYLKLWHNTMNPIALNLISDAVKHGNFTASAINIFAKHTTSGEYERAVAQRALQQRASEAYMFFFLPHAAGVRTDMKLIPGTVPMETAGYKLNVEIEPTNGEDGVTIYAALTSDDTSIKVGNELIRKRDPRTDAGGEVQLGLARLEEERAMYGIRDRRSRWDEDEELMLPNYGRYLGEYPPDLAEEMEQLERVLNENDYMDDGQEEARDRENYRADFDAFN